MAEQSLSPATLIALEEYKALNAEVIQRNSQGYTSGFGCLVALGTILTGYLSGIGRVEGYVFIALAASVVILFIYLYRMVNNDLKLACWRLQALEEFINKSVGGSYESTFPLHWQRRCGILPRRTTGWVSPLKKGDTRNVLIDRDPS